MRGSQTGEHFLRVKVATSYEADERAKGYSDAKLESKNR